jgi:hypothetical protein
LQMNLVGWVPHLFRWVPHLFCVGPPPPLQRGEREELNDHNRDAQQPGRNLPKFATETV